MATDELDGKILFLVPVYPGDEKWLDERLAGLSIAERLYHHAMRAGVDDIRVICNNPSGEHWGGLVLSVPEDLHDCDEFQKVVICRPRFLPDIDCMKEIREFPIGENELLVHEGLLAFKPSQDCFELGRLLRSHGFTNLLNFLSTFMTRIEFSCPKGKIFDLRTPSKVKEAEDAMFKGLIKDTEGFMSRYVERRISIAISKRLVNTPITPNQITVISTIIGLIGAMCISISQGFWQIIGSLLFLFHSIVDGCDGEIARIKFMESKFGGILDFWGDNLVHSAVFAAIGIEWAARQKVLYPLVLSGMAVFGTVVSATIVFVTTMLHKQTTNSPLYTSVAGKDMKSKVVAIADFLSRRDFIYLVVLLAFYHHLDWFIMLSAIGTLVFAATLIWIRLRR